MAYKNQTTAANKSAAAAAPGTNGTEGNFTRANGFVNLYIVGANGSKKKLGGIPLYKHKFAENQLMDWLMAEGKDEAETTTLRADRIQKLLNSLTIDFQPVADEPKGFDLPS